MLSYPAGLSVSNRTLITLSDALRRSRTTLGTHWRRLSIGGQALLALAHLRKAETYTELAAGFCIGATTTFRSIREAIDALAAQAPRRPTPSRSCWARRSSSSTPPWCAWTASG